MKSLITMIFFFRISYIAFPQLVYQPEAKSEQDGANVGLKPGYKVIVEVGFGIPVGFNGESRVKLNLINGIQFNPYTSIGIGTGFLGVYDRMLVPVFADFRCYILNKKTSPYLSFDMGYSFNADNSFEGQGFLWSISIGININLSRNISMNLGVGYDSQKLDWYNSHIIYPSPGRAVRVSEFDSGMSGALLINLGCSF
jgi:hypothetical protein